MTQPFTCKIINIDEFGAAVLDITPEELAEKGFDLGDTLDFAFSNGVKLENVPYFNGFTSGSMSRSLSPIPDLNTLRSTTIV